MFAGGRGRGVEDLQKVCVHRIDLELGDAVVDVAHCSSRFRPQAAIALGAGQRGTAVWAFARAVDENAAMPFTADTAKPPLLDEMRTIERAQALWTLIGALTGASLGLAVAPLAAAVAGPAALCVYALQLNKIDVNRILNDPPRPDYEVPVRARRRRFTARDVQSPIEVATAEFVERVLDSSAYLEAAVRADERGQEALAVGDHVQFQRRLFEGGRATERAAVAADRVAAASDRLSDAWSSSTDPDLALGDPALRAAVTRGMRGQVDAIGVFPTEALAYVARTRLVTEHLRPVVRVNAADAQAVVSNPHEAIRARSAAYGAAAAKATRIVRDTYGQESRLEPRDWRRPPER